MGWLLDRIGRRLGLSFGYLIGITGCVIAIWSIVNGTILGFLAGAALLGGSRASSEQGRYIAAEVYPSSQQARVIGTIVFAGTIGAVVGPLLVVPSGSIADIYGIDTMTGPFFVAGGLLLVALIAVFLLLRPDPDRASRELNPDTNRHSFASSKDQTSGRPLRQIFKASPVILAVAAMVIGQLVMALLMVITPLHMNHNEHALQSISFVIMAHTLGMFGFSWLTGWLIGRTGRMRMISLGAVILMIACLLAPISTGVPLLSLALFLLGLGWNFCFIAGSTLLSEQLAVTERGRAQGVGEMAVALGAGTGSISSGLLFSLGGIVVVSLVGLGFSIALLGIVTRMLISRRSMKVILPSQSQDIY
jgi:MFS family permease